MVTINFKSHPCNYCKISVLAYINSLRSDGVTLSIEHNLEEVDYAIQNIIIMLRNREKCISRYIPILTLKHNIMLHALPKKCPILIKPYKFHLHKTVYVFQE